MAGVVELQVQLLGCGQLGECGLVKAQHALELGQALFVLVQGLGQGGLLGGVQRAGAGLHGGQQQARQALGQVPVAGAELHIGGDALGRGVCAHGGVKAECAASGHVAGPALQRAATVCGAGQA